VGKERGGKLKFTMLFLVLLAGCAKSVAPALVETAYAGELLPCESTWVGTNDAALARSERRAHGWDSCRMTSATLASSQLIPKPKHRKRRRDEFRVQEHDLPFCGPNVPATKSCTFGSITKLTIENPVKTSPPLRLRCTFDGISWRGIRTRPDDPDLERTVTMTCTQAAQ
jgi:hypothetical protein